MAITTVNSPTLHQTSNPHLATSEVLLRKLLVAIDFSKASKAVVKHAIAIAKCFDSEIFLVNAATPVIYGTGAEPIPIETFDVNLSIANARMKELVDGEPAFEDCKYQSVVAYAGALDLLRDVAEREKIDLIIAGSHGASGIERLALGSVAESILRHVSCPVLIVGPHANPGQHPFRSVLFATDLKTTGLRAAQYATSLAERFHGKIDVVYVLSSTAQHDPEVNEVHLEQALERLLPTDLSSYCIAKLRVAHGKPGDEILAIARNECASLIVTGVREDSTMADHSPRSTLSHIIRDATCPVLVVRRHIL